MMKPLFRWVIGPVFPAGFDCLRAAYRRLKNIYGLNADYLICHNQLSEQQLFQVESMDCPTYAQSGSELSILPSRWPYDIDSMDGTRNSWKLYPPRLAIDRHEIVMDNDIIIYNIIPTIESFLVSDRPMISQARNRNFGIFDRIIPKKYSWNCGIVGLPPKFNYEKEFLLTMPSGFRWEGFFDEQGLSSAALINHNPLVIPMEEMSICLPVEVAHKAPGVHFVGLNSNKRHVGWESFKNRSIKML